MLDRNSPFATVTGDTQGRFYVQGGNYFRSDDTPWVAPPGVDDLYITGRRNFGHGEVEAVRLADVKFVDGAVAPVDAVAATNTLTSDNTNVNVLTAATDTITSSNVQVTANDTVTINGKVYKFVAAPTVEGDVHFVTDANTSLANLAAAVNHTGTPDTDYKCAAAHPTVSAGAVNTGAHTVLLSARTAGAAGNALTLAVSAATLSVTGAVFAGGFDNDTVTVNGKVYSYVATLTPLEGEVLKGATADLSLTNLVSAINHAGTPDTDYKCAAAHPTVSAAAVGSHATVLSAKTKGVAGNALTLAETSAHLSKTGANFAGGSDGTPGAVGDEIIVNGVYYKCLATATIATSGAWKQVTTAGL